MHAEFYDPIAPSAAQQFCEWLEKQENDIHHSRNGTLSLLDNTGDVVEEWKLSGMKLQVLDFGNLDYSSNEFVTVCVTLEVQSAKLQF